MLYVYLGGKKSTDGMRGMLVDTFSVSLTF